MLESPKHEDSHYLLEELYLVVCVPRVRVRTIGPFIARLGFHQREVLLAGHTVRDLLRQLEGELGGRFRDAVLDEEGRLRPYIKILVNGRGIHVSGGLDTPLSDGDVVAIFPPIAGGTSPRLNHPMWWD